MRSATLYGVTDTLEEEHHKYAEALRGVYEAFEAVDKMVRSQEFEEKSDWTKEAEDDEGTEVHSKTTTCGKMITVKNILVAHPDLVMQEYWAGMENQPEWNPRCAFSKLIAAPTNNFDIYHSGSNEVFIFSARDVVCARIYRKMEDGYLMAVRSVELTECPEDKSKIRAEIILGGARIQHHPTNPGQTLLQTILHADPKGMIPKFLLNQIIGRATLMDAKTNRQYFEGLVKKKESDREINGTKIFKGEGF